MKLNAFALHMFESLCIVNVKLFNNMLFWVLHCRIETDLRYYFRFGTETKAMG